MVPTPAQCGLYPEAGRHGRAPKLMTSCPQVPFFLFVIFVVYTLLPLSMQGAVVVGVISSASHLLVLGALMGDFAMPSVQMWLQVRVRGPAEASARGLRFGQRAARPVGGSWCRGFTAWLADRWP